MRAKKLLEKAHKGKYAIGAFNAANLETLKAIFNAAKKLKSPVIVEASPGEAEFIGAKNLQNLSENMSKEANIPVLVNLDHALLEKNIYSAMKAGFDLLHFDGSKLDLDENIRRLREVVKKVHRRGKLVEGEMDYITGSSSAHLDQDIKTMLDPSKYTDPLKAEMFVRKTNVDILAIFIGNVHGIYKTPPILDMERLKKIKEHTDCYFSLHGGSGIPEKQVKDAIRFGGIVKVNVNTELRLAYRVALEKALKNSNEVAIYKLMPDVVTAVQKVVEAKIKIFGSANKA